MIKAENLMAGDWIKCGPNNRIVSEINMNTITTDCRYISNYDKIEPIPLSKDLMDANFELDEGYYDEYFKEKGILPYKMLFTATYPDGSTMKNYWHLLYNTNINELRIEDDPCIYVKYVHELQHMLRLMGQRGDIKLVYNPNNPT